MVGNYNGITLIDSGDRARSRPAPHGPHILQNVWVHGNTITGFTGQTGAFEDHHDPAIFTTNHNRFDANRYYVGSLTGPAGKGLPPGCPNGVMQSVPWTLRAGPDPRSDSALGQEPLCVKGRYDPPDLP